MTTPAIFTLLSALGAGAILLKLVEVVLQRLMGRQKREQDAWTQRDREARARRMLEEYAGDLRLLAREHGIPREDIPAWPEYRTTDN